jgi:hypothetical protein
MHRAALPPSMHTLRLVPRMQLAARTARSGSPAAAAAQPQAAPGSSGGGVEQLLRDVTSAAPGLRVIEVEAGSDAARALEPEREHVAAADGRLVLLRHACSGQRRRGRRGRQGWRQVQVVHRRRCRSWQQACV